MEFFMADLAFELKKTKEGFYLKTYFLKSLHFGYCKNSVLKWVARIPKTVIRKIG